MTHPPIHVKRWMLVYTWIVLFTGLTVYITYQNHDLAKKGAKTHTAICSFRNDLGERIKQAQTFLAKHPNGVPGLATRTDILTSIVNEQSTYDSLAQLDC